MKKKTKIVSAAICVSLAAVSVIGGCFYIRLQRFNEYKSDKTPLPSGFTYTAHTGCADTPENSLESIEKGAENGALIVEFDLSFSSDNIPVLSHDAPKGGEVTLEEAFRKLSGYETLRANVDVKSTANLAEVQRLAEEYGLLDRIFYTGVNLDFLDAVRRDSPKIRYYLNVDIEKSKNKDREYIESLVRTVSESGAIGINFCKDNATKEIVSAFHDAGLLVSIWTADSDFDIYRVLSLAPDNITTRRPGKMKNILSERVYG
ncbi:MAG: glycerophosphodiester phosphodiesterase [Oscillospiraceae bacterium]|nr:glycerophosphodiester phosphodiesterase [Oscillospiraceae bacterium]